MLRTISKLPGSSFSLPPACIHSVFPPEGSLGDHSEVLPQIILNRSTLPWERSAKDGDGDTPWLALLGSSPGTRRLQVLTRKAAGIEGP